MRATPSPAAPFPPQLLQPLLRATEQFGRWAVPFRALILFAFVTFARLGSLLPVLARGFDCSRFPVLSDLAFDGEGGTFNLKFSKTRQAAHPGFRIPFLTTGNLHCPVRVALELRAKAQRLGFAGSSPLFAAVTGLGQAPVSLTQARARFLLKLGLRDFPLLS